MKTQRSNSRLPLAPLGQRIGKPGFALIVTLSLMILLTVIAVGLLTLSSISLRSASQGNEMSVARANARLALMMALGDLQKYAGPDQRVTARADLLDESIANPKLTGVWESWNIEATSPPSASDYDRGARDAKFLGWLTSSLNPQDTTAVGFASNPVSANPKDYVELWGEGTLGSNAPDADIVSAAKVPTNDGNGAFAYAVMDEGVKVRINTSFDDDAPSQAEQIAQLGSGQVANAGFIPGLNGLKTDYFEENSVQFASLKKGVTKQNFEKATDSVLGGTGQPNSSSLNTIKALTHDVTSLSQGLLTDAANGGLKEDFSLLANSGLPSKYSGKGVYSSLLNVSPASDPKWGSLHEFAGLHRDSNRLSKAGGVPVLNAGGPSGWTASTNANVKSERPGNPLLAPPDGVVLMPTVAKVQVVFSLLVRDIYKYNGRDGVPMPPQTLAWEKSSSNWTHGTWANSFAGSSYDYLLHLMYTPVVTLHNPYNVALNFRDLKVVFGNVPFAVQVIRNGIPQTTKPAPLDLLYYKNSETGNQPKRFGMTLKTKTNRGTPGSSSFTMLPGEVLLFSPYITPTRTWYQDSVASNSAKEFSDWDTGRDGNGRTISLNGIPGWQGDAIGFDLDWFCPSYQRMRVSNDEIEGGKSYNRAGCIGVRAVDRFQVKFAPLNVETLSKNKYTIEIFATPQGSGRQVASGTIELDYQSPMGLQGTVADPSGVLTYPKSGTIGAMEMHSNANTPIANIATAKPFAIVSAQTKSTLSGQRNDNEDGTFVTKPWSFGHGSTGASSVKVTTEGLENGSHEFSFVGLGDQGVDNYFQVNSATGRGRAITGHTSSTGRSFGALYDIPLAPVQSLASLNGANPGGSSGYLPRFAQPIGNSWAHPMLDPGSIITGGTYADHSFLLNLALYDRFFFSGLESNNGPFGTGENTSEIVEDFIEGKALTDPRLALHTPDGKIADDLKTDAADSEAYAKIAKWLMMNGAFNINSTSVPAWKAMLGSIRDAQAIFNGRGNGTATSLSNLPATDDDEVRVSRFRLPASESEADGSIAEDAYWLGPREYTDTELQTLAENIVIQVRKRGPFLSMSDFVNRQIGSGETAQRGALQQAIDDSNLNSALALGAYAGYDIDSSKVGSYQYKNSKAGIGPSYQGAPGYLSQADLLSVLGNAATARSDTFTIRGYGESRNRSGNVTASATCEAVVQRVPDYLDPVDNPETQPVNLSNDTNRIFGRRFEIVSFRWLSQSEI